MSGAACSVPVSLILGSGGARGIAHIGVLDWLDEHQVGIGSIAGCSMGALVGGIYAAGQMGQFKDWLLAMDKSQVLQLLDFSYRSDGLLKGDRVMGLLRELVGDHDIETLPVHFTAVATDIDAEREVWFSSGSLFDAIRASIAIPGVFTPVSWQGRRLVDGGLLNPLPIAPTFAADPMYRIAVNLCAPFDPTLLPLVSAPTPAPELGAYRRRVADFMNRLYSGLEWAASGNLQFYDIFNQSIDTMQGALSRMKLAAYPPDICLEIPRNLCRGHEFYLAKPLIDYGYQLAAAQLPPLLARIAPPGLPAQG